MKEFTEQLLKRSPAPWSYYDYMDTALYDDKVGYYMKEDIKLGKDGDFFTSNHVHPVFQKTFARFFLDVINKEDLTPAICEWGAGDGRFAKNVIENIKATDSKVFEQLQYVIIEASPYHRQILMENLADYHEKVVVYSNLEEASTHISSFQGIVFSNELIDALPVHVVERQGDTLREIKVNMGEEGSFEEVKAPCEKEELIDWIVDYGPPLPDGHRMEINLPMKSWLSSVSKWMEKGLLVTVDYGYSNEELLAPERKDGSLRGYYNHEMIDNPLLHSGEMDLTTHIQWDAFASIAKEHGYKEVYHKQQDQFLVEAGLFTFLQEVETMMPFSDGFRQNRAIQTLVQLGGISSFFQVNVQGLGLEKQEDYKIFNEDPYQMIW